ncbi:hypothetical protein SYK_28080 [Pseudodesulfovibrio nedwellii]|uniref:Type II secretion system protein M n=1 Tax=Pseudodesulfovibrio nedwellii TaxID=2973072 RepID=A0ABM8B3P8_9BACT|nr:hypothetical protein [Pseudodesulfovibrio nedwellii]BDQ38448.1 hypothetical protein SYK_28080 [Pseudodesulfovibrio nedwellii]
MSALSLDMHISRPVRIMIGMFVVIVIGVGIFLPMARQQDDGVLEISAARDEYLKALDSVQRYTSIKAGENSKTSVILKEQLFSYVEKVSRNLKLNKRIDYIRPGNRTKDDGSIVEVVHVSFKGISLDEFVRFLYHIEVQKREIYIEAISIKKDSKKNLNTQMTLQKRG